MPVVTIPEVPQKQAKAESEISNTAAGLYQSVANCYALIALSHTAHFGVVGCNFMELHELFGGHYNDALEKADLFGERLRALGYQVKVDLSSLDALAAMPVAPAAPFGCDQIVPVLIAAHEKNISDLKKLMLSSGQEGDLVTQNMVMGVIEAEQKTIWMLKSHLLGT